MLPDDRRPQRLRRHPILICASERLVDGVAAGRRDAIPRSITAAVAALVENRLRTLDGANVSVDSEVRQAALDAWCRAVTRIPQLAD